MVIDYALARHFTEAAAVRAQGTSPAHHESSRTEKDHDHDHDQEQEPPHLATSGGGDGGGGGVCQSHSCGLLWDAQTLGERGASALPAEPSSSWGFVYDADHRKWGWRAVAEGAALVLRVRAGQSGSLVLSYTRSYGRQWADATVQVLPVPASTPGDEAAACAAPRIRDLVAARAAHPTVRGSGDPTPAIVLSSRWTAGVSLDAMSSPIPVAPNQDHCVVISLVAGTGSAFKLRGARAC